MSGEGARAAAAKALVLVERGMHLPQAIESVLGGSKLLAPDRGLTTELAYGTERWRSRLDHSLRPWLKRELRELDPAVRALLRQGAYQLIRLKTPGYAVVDASVSAAALCGAGGARGLVNAVLRRVSENGEPALPEGTIERLAIEFAHPVWLVRRWVERLGEEEARELLLKNQEVPPIVLRANRTKTTREELQSRLRQAGAEPHEILGLPDATELRGAGDIRHLPGWDEGLFQVQDVGAQAVGESIPAVGDFLEAACGLGTKTLHQAERRAAGVRGMDLDPRRIERARQESKRLGLRAQFIAGDARNARELAGPAKEVLLDAPCSALAVVSRRPDAKWRRREEDLRRNGELQIDLLRAAYAAVQEGGALTYSVCSLEPEETLEPVERFLKESGAIALDVSPPLTERSLRVGFRLPGMYVVRIRRAGSQETA